jgi:hypothetical protein
MRVVSRIAAFVVTGFLLSLPALSAEDKDKKADPKKDDANKTDVKKDETPKKGNAKKLADKNADKDTTTEKMVKAGEVIGKVMAVIESKKSIRIQVTLQVPKLNPGALQGIQQAQLNLLRANTPQAMIQAQQNLARAQAGLYTMENVQKDYELEATDDVKVRMNNPPAQFDDKGRIKRYTAKELKELKGNDKQPGFPAEFSDLKQDQIVKVTLIRKKGAPRAPVKKGKDVDPDLLNDFLPQMSAIIILAEPKE